MYNLANRYSEAGRRQEALQLLERVVAAQKRTLGEEHPDTLYSINNLAILNATEESAALLPTLSSYPLNTQNRTEQHNAPSTNTIKRFDISRWWGRDVNETTRVRQYYYYCISGYLGKGTSHETGCGEERPFFF
jgi:hypothetical protein